MGCGVSTIGCKVSNQTSTSEDAEMKLASCRLIFSSQQLLKLNRKFANMLEGNLEVGKSKEKQTACLGVVVERLIQRLVCTVGTLDSRFSSKFLINLEPMESFNHEPKRSLKFKYLVRLDLVSTPALYPEYFEPPIRIVEGTDQKSLPQGYAKIRVHGEFLEKWAGFISPNGFLRRDKVQEKFLELLTRAAARPSEPFSPAEVDESRHCGSPGKIVDPITLSQVLKNPATHQVFFGSAECNESRFPDPRDFRIAIVEGVPETRLHISFLSPTAQSITSDAEITITLGIGVSGWPIGTDFPTRLPLDHVDVMLGYRASQLDYYLVPKGPHSSAYCEDRTSVWEIRALPTEMFLEHHYSPMSTVARVYKILTFLLEILKARGVKTINKYILKNLQFFELEQKRRIQHWKPKAVSRRVISILERLLVSLQNQSVPHYIFPEKNILLQDDAFDDDYASDRDILEHYLRQMHNDEFKVEVEDAENHSVKDELENVLLKKWDNVIANMLPPRSNKTNRLSVVNNSPAIISYTRHQIEYVALLIREMLKLKNIQRKSALSDGPSFKTDVSDESTDKDDFIYLLRIMFEQAKQKLLANSAASLHFKKTSSRKLLKLDQLLMNYDLSTAMLIDDVKRNKQTDFKFTDDLSLVIKIMECLYKAMDSDGKVLGPVLRPYLNQIFKGSHENCSFLSEWNKKADFSEFEAIGVFSKLVLTGDINPLEGILNSASKGWDWASNCLRIMQTIAQENSTRIIIGEKIDLVDSGVRLIFAPAPGKTIRLNVSLTKQLSRDNHVKNLNETKTEKHSADSRYATIKSFQDGLESTITPTRVEMSQEYSEIKEVVPIANLKLKSEKSPLHVQLREGNPFTLASMETRRRGNHRGLGSIVQALISLQKLTVLQEISVYLPEDERIRVLSDIKKLSKEVQRAAVENCKKKSFPFSGRKSRFIVKQKSANPFSPTFISHKRISNAFSGDLKSQELPMSGTYRSMNEFSVSSEKEEIQKALNSREKQLDEEIKKEEGLRGTCRQLRKCSRAAVIEIYTDTVWKRNEFKYQFITKKKLIQTPSKMTNATGNITGAYKGGIPLNVTLHAWPIPKFETNLKQTNETNYMIDKNSESAKNYTNSLHNLNATGYVAIEDDLTDTGLTDVQTFILAGIATVIPLLVIVVMILGIRFLWRRYRAKKEDGYEGVLQKDESSEPLGKLQSYSLPQELKTSESQFTVSPGEDLDNTPSTQLPTPKSNGSVIRMTLKNNHLIVETEETINAPEGNKVESKGTTTKFTLKASTMAPDLGLEGNCDNGANYNKQPSVPYSLERGGIAGIIPSSSDHGALVHCAPEETEDELERGSINTGLSQSDLSVSSSESQNPSYRYGNQMGYDSGGYGYAEYSGYSTFPTHQSNQSQKGPKTRAIYTRGYSVSEQTDSCQSGSHQLKDILMSDIQAREKREHDIKQDEENNLQNNNLTADNATELTHPTESSLGQPTKITEEKELQVTQSKNENLKLDNNEFFSNNAVINDENAEKRKS